MEKINILPLAIVWYTNIHLNAIFYVIFFQNNNNKLNCGPSILFIYFFFFLWHRVSKLLWLRGVRGIILVWPKRFKMSMIYCNSYLMRRFSFFFREGRTIYRKIRAIISMCLCIFFFLSDLLVWGLLMNNFVVIFPAFWFDWYLASRLSIKNSLGVDSIPEEFKEIFGSRFQSRSCFFLGSGHYVSLHWWFQWHILVVCTVKWI